MPKPAVAPVKILDDLWAARISLALIAAVDLDIFTQIAQGNRTVESIAKAVKAPKRGIERLLEALVGMGYLTRRGTQLGLTAIADTFLVRTKPSFIGAMADESGITLPGWMRLADVIRSGKSVAQVNTDISKAIFGKSISARSYTIS